MTWKSAWKSGIEQKWAVTGFPTMYLLDRDGRIREMGHHLNLEKLVPELIAEKPAKQSGDDTPVEEEGPAGSFR